MQGEQQQPDRKPRVTGEEEYFDELAMEELQDEEEYYNMDNFGG